MDFDNPKVYGDTFISDGLVYVQVLTILYIAKTIKIFSKFHIFIYLYHIIIYIFFMQVLAVLHMPGDNYD